jgi:hypothetical protein
LNLLSDSYVITPDAGSSGGIAMFVEVLSSLLAAFVPTEIIGCALLAAGLCFTFVYVATLVTILACHLEEL